MKCVLPERSSERLEALITKHGLQGAADILGANRYTIESVRHVGGAMKETIRRLVAELEVVS